MYDSAIYVDERVVPIIPTHIEPIVTNAAVILSYPINNINDVTNGITIHRPIDNPLTEDNAVNTNIIIERVNNPPLTLALFANLSSSVRYAPILCNTP